MSVIAAAAASLGIHRHCYRHNMVLPSISQVKVHQMRMNIRRQTRLVRTSMSFHSEGLQTIPGVHPINAVCACSSAVSYQVVSLTHSRHACLPPFDELGGSSRPLKNKKSKPPRS